MTLHLPKLTAKDGSNILGKTMCKSMNTTETTKGLYEKFQQERGAMAAFCREKGITQEWLRLVFSGQFEDLDLLIDAADFLVRFKKKRQEEREQKVRLLNEKVQALGAIV